MTSCFAICPLLNICVVILQCNELGSCCLLDFIIVIFQLSATYCFSLVYSLTISQVLGFASSIVEGLLQERERDADSREMDFDSMIRVLFSLLFDSLIDDKFNSRLL